MSGQDRIPEPPRDPAGRQLDPSQQFPAGGRRHMNASPSPAPVQWATHRLISIAARFSERRLNRQFARLHLTKSALDALDAVAELEQTTVTDVAALLCVSSQSLGKVLRRLRASGSS